MDFLLQFPIFLIIKLNYLTCLFGLDSGWFGQETSEFRIWR